MIVHNGQELARLDNGVVEPAELICGEFAVLGYALLAMGKS